MEATFGTRDITPRDEYTISNSEDNGISNTSFHTFHRIQRIWCLDEASNKDYFVKPNNESIEELEAKGVQVPAPLTEAESAIEYPSREPVSPRSHPTAQIQHGA